MARMIPSNISPEIRSNAERKVFEWFKNAPQTEDWTVLHSLGISNHRTVIYGEIDFVVIAPKLGVYAIEVKGGRIRRENGAWYFTNKYGKTAEKKRGPFEQAKEGIFSLFDHIERKKGKGHRLSKLIYGSAVMFPDVTFRIDDSDIEPWQIFDENNGQNVRVFIEILAKNAKRKWVDTYHFWDPMKLPDIKTVRELTDLLRSDFEMIMSMGTIIREAEENLIELTKEQLKCLDQIEDNPRCLIAGAAGTGKTLLAIEDVKRSVTKGESVALFCFNSNLADWLHKNFEMLDKELQPQYVGSFHSFLYSHANLDKNYVNQLDEAEKNKFYSEELPLIAALALEEKEIRFDKIIIDEAQDILYRDYIDVMDILLKGGIARGKWSMYGDFQMQAIYSNMSPKLMEELLEEKTQFIRYKLVVNCRNTKPIGDEIKYITGFESTQNLWLKSDGPPVNYYKYDNEEKQLEMLTDLIKSLKKDKVKDWDITILSPFKRSNSVVSMLPVNLIEDYLPGSNSRISFSTINGFKGLENSVIILVDIDTFSYEKLMYVGLSRARVGLYIFETLKADRERKELLKRWI
jgi:hypothetical protein